MCVCVCVEVEVQCVCVSGHLMSGSVEYLSNALINSFIQMLYILSQLVNR